MGGEYCKTGKRNSRIWRISRTLPTPVLSYVRFNPRGLHYDGMHNARWVRRRAVCASYIAMADGRDSEKDFPNGISSPRTAYIFHGRGRANRLPLLSSIFCAPCDISPLSSHSHTPSDRCGRTEHFAELESRSVETGWKIREKDVYSSEKYIRNDDIARKRRGETYIIYKENCFDYKNLKTFTLFNFVIFLNFI